MTTTAESTPTVTTDPTDTTEEIASERQLGICKWFDKMKGFGFVQGLDDKRDFFAHHTQINRSPDTSKAFDENVFRYLVAGEYVEFTINEQQPDDDEDEDTARANSNKRVMAACVTGLRGGPLMFQTQLQQQEELQAKYGNSHAHTPPNTNYHNNAEPVKTRTDKDGFVHRNPRTQTATGKGGKGYYRNSTSGNRYSNNSQTGEQHHHHYYQVDTPWYGGKGKGKGGSHRRRNSSYHNGYNSKRTSERVNDDTATTTTTATSNGFDALNDA